MTDKRCIILPEEEPRLEVNPEGSRHYGKWVCGECGKWLTHAKMPKTVEELEERQRKIREMIRSDLTDDELHRLLKLYNKPHLGVEAIWYNDIINK